MGVIYETIVDLEVEVEVAELAAVMVEVSPICA